MKQLYVICLIAIFLNAAAQTTNYAQHSGQRKTFNIESLNNKSYYLVSDFQIGSCCIEKVKLIAHNTDGSKLLEKTIGQSGVVNAALTTVLANKTLLLQYSSAMYQCDVGGPRTVLCNYDTLGNLLWTKIFPRQMAKALPKSDGSFFAVRSDSLVHYNANGQIITKFLLNGGLFQYAACLTGAGSIIYCKYSNGSGYTIEKIDTAANVLNSQPATNLYTDLYELSSNALAGTSGGEVLKLNGNLAPVLSSTVNLTSFTAKTTYVKADTIYSAGLSSSGNLLFVRLDSNLTVISTSTSNIESSTASGICIGRDQNLRLINKASSESTFSDTYSFSSFFQFAKTAAIDGSKDIGVIASQLLSYTNSVNFQPQKVITTVSLQVTVKNFGTDTVKYFKLNSFAKVTGISTCIFGLHKEYFVSIAPQASVVVNTPAFDLAPMSVPSLTSTLSFSTQICIYTSVPDSLHDMVVGNNMACGNFDFVYQPTGIEVISGKQTVSVFPNPASEQVSIVAGENIVHLSICDNLGRVLVQVQPDETEYQLDCSKLAKGIYFLSVKTENDLQQKKILID